MTIRVLIADDQQGIRDAFRMVLDAQPDSTYFVELRQMQFTWTWRASLRAMDPQSAMQRLRRAHMVSSSWPGTPMRPGT